GLDVDGAFGRVLFGCAGYVDDVDRGCVLGSAAEPGGRDRVRHRRLRRLRLRRGALGRRREVPPGRGVGLMAVDHCLVLSCAGTAGGPAGPGQRSSPIADPGSSAPPALAPGIQPIPVKNAVAESAASPSQSNMPLTIPAAWFGEPMIRNS